MHSTDHKPTGVRPRHIYLVMTELIFKLLWVWKTETFFPPNYDPIYNKLGATRDESKLTILSL